MRRARYIGGADGPASDQVGLKERVVRQGIYDARQASRGRTERRYRRGFEDARVPPCGPHSMCHI
ncbi:MAG TPA: hypothetical protein VEH08_06870, partial [Methanomassiliicoccales archaeon]|nr:hypothetical protein [Methanomassiliicoccales archaeon]